jgi:hypothetical protein
MLLFLYLIPLFVVISGILVYPHNGKREFLKLDLVQFFYAFIVAPLMFVWLKSFMYILLKTELGDALSSGQLFIIDTAFSLLSLYIFAFVVIHSLTATFNRRIVRDPLYDMFAHSEFFHLWLSHIVMFGGLMAVLTIIGIANVFLPLNMSLTKPLFYLLCGSGIVAGLLSFMMVWLSDPRQEGARFMRLMKLMFGIFFILFCVVYFIFAPSFTAERGMYWWSFSAITSLAACSFFTYKSTRAYTWVERLSNRFKHLKWGSNIQLFKD